MSGFDDGYNDSMRKYFENISKMTKAVQGMYSSESYMNMIRSVQRISGGLQSVYTNQNYMKSIQAARKISNVVSLTMPKKCFNQNTLKSMTKLAESVAQSTFANIEPPKMYEALQKKFAPQLKIVEQTDFIKIGDKIRQSMPDFESISANLQRAVMAIQPIGYSVADETEDEVYDECSSDIEQIFVGNLSDEEMVERNEKSEGKLAKLLYKLITIIITAFFTGYLQHISEPVYELIDKVIVKEDINELSKEIGTPIKGTKFTIWAKEDGYIEINYEDENGSVQGYISEDEFNNKSKLVQAALDEEQLLFESNCLVSMAEYWNVNLDETNKRLNEDFDIIKEYIIPEYPRLVGLADEELVLDIDREYKRRQNKKIEEQFQKPGYYSHGELGFVVFCIESLAEDMSVDPVLVYDALARKSDIVDQYIIPCYETLHTQGKEYIIENLKEVMEERGITV